MAQASPYSIVVDFSGTAARNAALYFDYVVPMTSIPGRPERLSSITKVVGDEIVAHTSLKDVVRWEHYGSIR